MRPARRPVHDLPPVFRGRDAVDQRVLTVQQLRGPLVRRVVQGVYRPSWVPLTHELKCQAVALVLPAGAAVTGRSAATVLGVELARPGDEVEVCVPAGTTVRPRVGVAARWVKSGLGPTRVVNDVRVVEAGRMGFDLAARTPLTTAVAQLDAVARARLLSAADLQHWLEGRRENDVVHVRHAAGLVDPRAESLPESQTRVILQEAGIDVVPQYEVRVLGHFVARLDLALVAERVAVEYDGTWHALREQLRRDRERLNALERAGWSVVHVTANLLADPDQLVAVVRAAAHSRQRRLA